MTRSVRIVIGCLVVGLGAIVAGQQQSSPQPQFRTGVDVLQLDVSVLDGKRRPVTGLTAADFTVEVGGRPAPLVAFTPVGLPPPTPPAAPWLREVAPDVATNTMSEEGRMIVILIDYSLEMPMTLTVRKIAHAAIDAMSADDMAAVVYLWQGQPQNFTTDRARLKRAIDQPYMPFTDPPPAFCWCNLCRLESMSTVADALREVPQRRKEILYLGSKIEFQGSPRSQCFIELKDAREKLFSALDRSNVTVHSIDPAGLRLGIGATQDQLNLGLLPQRTGGRVVINTNDPDTHVPAIMAESESYYVLGVERPPPGRNGRDQKIEVKVKQRGVQVASRRAYTAPAPPARRVLNKPDDPPPALVDAVAPVWPMREISMSTTVAAFDVPGSEDAAVLVISDVHQPFTSPATEGAGQATRPMTVLAGSWDKNGKPVVTHTQTLSVRPATTQAGPVKELRYQVASRLGLRRGAHEVRVAVEDLGTRTRGSVYTYVDVPDFRRDDLSLSGVIVGAAPAAPLAPDNIFSDLLPIVPTALRAFTRSSTVVAFVRAYQGGTAAPGDARLTARLLGVANQPIINETTTLDAARFRLNRSADYFIQLPVEMLTPGPYLLTLEAALATTAVRRDLRFEMK